jgi:hypothetical protein
MLTLTDKMGAKMNRAFAVLALLVTIAVSPQVSRAQGETAVPFLLIPPSAEGNGMGGIVNATETDRPMGILANPGLLGISSLDHFFLGGLYPSSTTWLPGIPGAGATYSANAFSAGLNLNRFADLPLGLSVGFGYSHVSLDYGLFAETGPNGPDVIGYYNPEEHSNNWSVGIGADYYLKLGLGYTHKSVTSSLAPFNVQNQSRQGVAEFSTYDLGAVAQLPILRIVDDILGSALIIGPDIHPTLDVTVGYARRNLGDDFVAYIDPAQADPLPRTSTLGISYKVGLSLPIQAVSLEAVSFTLAREADDLLVQRFPAPVDSAGNTTGPPPNPKYSDGGGAIQFYNNVILGEGNGHITLRKGWQVGIGEFFLIRGGSVHGRGVAYTTSGYGFRLGAIFKLFEMVSPLAAATRIGGFILSHIDAGFDHSSITTDDPSDPNNGLTFNGLSLTIK